MLDMRPNTLYPLDDVSGNPRDVSGNGNHVSGTSGTLTYQAAPLFGNSSLQFAASSFLTPTITTPFDGAFTIAFLAQYGSVANFAPVFSKGITGHSLMTHVESGPFGMVFDTTSSGSLSAVTAAVNYPYLIVWTCGGTGVSAPVALYVNGRSMFTGLETGSRSNTGTQRIGATVDTFWGSYTGLLSHFAVWSRALGPVEVGQLWRACGGDRYPLRSRLR